MSGYNVSVPSTSAQSSHLTPVISKSMEMVFVYDIEILTMLSEKHVEVTKKVRPHVPVNMIHNYLRCHLSKYGHDDSNRLEVINIENVVDDGSESAKKMVAKYEDLQKMYKFELDILRNQMKTVTKEFKELNFFMDRWKSAKRCLQLFDGNFDQSYRDQYTNVVLCGDGVAHGAVELALSGLATEVPLENIYSTKTRRTEVILEVIQKRFGRNCRLVVITANSETISATGNVKLPLYHKYVACNEDFDALYAHQRKRWLPQKHQEDKHRRSLKSLIDQPVAAPSRIVNTVSPVPLDQNNNSCEKSVRNNQQQQKQHHLEELYEAVLESTHQYEQLREFRRQRQEGRSESLIFIHGNRSGSAVFRSPQQQHQDP